MNMGQDLQPSRAIRDEEAIKPASIDRLGESDRLEETLEESFPAIDPASSNRFD